MNVAKESESWDEVVSRRRMRLIGLLRQSAEGSEILAEALEALEELDRLHRSFGPAERERVGQDASAGRGRRRQRPAETASRFQVEQTRRGSYLAEHFSTNRQPFRCPEEMYNKTAAVLAKVKKPISFEEILANVRRAAEDALPDYLVRVCLRFWQSTDPPLVKKHRARYRPGRASQFRRDAHQAWNKLVNKCD